MVKIETPEAEKAKILLESEGYKEVIIIYAIVQGEYWLIKFSRAHKGKGREVETRRLRIPKDIIYNTANPT